MPEEGMPLRALQYTTLGEPDEWILCRDYDKMDENHKQITVRWYRKDGNLLASGLCFQLKSEQEMMLHSFSYFDPEKFWEDNPEDYDDEDEAWDEWYDDGDEPYDG